MLKFIIQNVFYTILFLILLLNTSCEDVIQIQLDEGKKMVVVDAFINSLQDQDQYIILTYSENYFSQETFKPVLGAKVTIKNLISNAVYEFKDDSQNGIYTFYPSSTNDTICKANVTYELTIEHGNNKFTALSNTKRNTVIDSVALGPDFRPTAASNKKIWYLFAKDVKGGPSDFYQIKSNQNKSFILAWDATPTFLSAFDGFNFVPPIAGNIVSRNKELKSGDSIRVDILSITRQTYDFITQMRRTTFNSGLFATTMENVKTNLLSSGDTKVVGWFSTSYAVSKTKIVP